MTGEVMTVRGRVQGVGFRPAVWRIAPEMGFSGAGRNTGDTVEIRLWGEGADRFADRLAAEAPALARIEAVTRATLHGAAPDGFSIVASAERASCTAVTPDAAVCDACADEIRDPFARRYRYPFTNCTSCGPRFSIVRAAPYDRARTTMAAFPPCAACAAEYADPTDRRFHARARAGRPAPLP